MENPNYVKRIYLLKECEKNVKKKKMNLRLMYSFCIETERYLSFFRICKLSVLFIKLKCIIFV